MTDSSGAASAANTIAKTLLVKVPAITAAFWIIKILCTTVGESAADFLNYNLNWGLTLTSVATGVLLAVISSIIVSTLAVRRASRLSRSI